MGCRSRAGTRQQPSRSFSLGCVRVSELSNTVAGVRIARPQFPATRAWRRQLREFVGDRWAKIDALRSEVDIRCRSTQIIMCRGRLPEARPGVCPFPLPFVERQGDASRTSPTANHFSRHNLAVYHCVRAACADAL
jgi:hypothetical protein